MTRRKDTGGNDQLNQPTKTMKGPRGESITLLAKPNDAPALMLVGDHDMVIAGYMGNNADHEDLLIQTLQVRDGKAKHAAEGLLRPDLAKIPAKAAGFIVGNVPVAAFRGVPFPLPVTINGYLLNTPHGLEAYLQATMANNDDARQLVTQLSQFHKQALESLKGPLNVPANNPLARQRTVLFEMLNSLQFEDDGNKVPVRMLIPDGILGAASSFLGMRANVP